MKQHISNKQLNELSKKGKEKLVEWYLNRIEFDDDIVHLWLPEEKMEHHGYWDEEREFEKAGYLGKIRSYGGEMLPLLSLGQMIEFLDERERYSFAKQNMSSHFLYYWTVRKTTEKQHISRRKELCDALWQAVKLILEK